MPNTSRKPSVSRKVRVPFQADDAQYRCTDCGGVAVRDGQGWLVCGCKRGIAIVGPRTLESDIAEDR